MGWKRAVKLRWYEAARVGGGWVGLAAAAACARDERNTRKVSQCNFEPRPGCGLVGKRKEERMVGYSYVGLCGVCVVFVVVGADWVGAGSRAAPLGVVG